MLFKNHREKQRLVALFDSGATHSLMRLDALSSKIQFEIKKFLSTGRDANGRGFRKCPLRIKGVTNHVSEDCVVVPVWFSIGSWSCVHSFVISCSLMDKEVLLGRDFLKRYGVVIDHSKDTGKIDSGKKKLRSTHVFWQVG